MATFFNEVFLTCEGIKCVNSSIHSILAPRVIITDESFLEATRLDINYYLGEVCLCTHIKLKKGLL